MTDNETARQRHVRPLDSAQLQKLAMAYVARYATSSGKLAGYLARKVAEKGWSGDDEPRIADLVNRMQERGFLDDQAFAEMRSQALARRGFGAARVRQNLAQAGIAKHISQPLLEAQSGSAVEIAMAFAQRKKFGPFSNQPRDQKTRQRALAAMIRAGHDYRTACQVLDLPES